MTPISVKQKHIYFSTFSVDSVAAWNGESQNAAIEVFERNHARVGLYRYLREFTAEFGIGLPSSTDVLKEGIRLAYAQVDGFIENKAKEGRMYARESFLANGGRGTDDDSKQFLVGGEFDEDGIVAINSGGTLVGGEQVVESRSSFLNPEAFGEKLDSVNVYNQIDDLVNNLKPNSIELDPGIWIIGHEIAENRWHVSLLLIPESSEEFRSYSSDDSGQFTLGAGPSIYNIAFANLGKLESEVNRPTDVKDLKDQALISYVQLPDGQSVNQAIRSILLTDASYNDDAEYSAAALGDQYNSNSYIAGVLSSAGISIPDLPDTIIVPGYDKPLPIANDE